MAARTPGGDVIVMDVDIPVSIEVEVSPGQLAYFIELFRGLATSIDPGDSLKEVRIIRDDALASQIQALSGGIYQQGPYPPSAVAVPSEQDPRSTGILYAERRNVG